LQLRAVNFDEQRGQYSDASSTRGAADPRGTSPLPSDARFEGSIPAAPQRDVYNIFTTNGKASQLRWRRAGFLLRTHSHPQQQTPITPQRCPKI